MGLKNVVPQSLELSKIEQMKVYGSEVTQIGDTVDEAIFYAQQQSELEGGYLPTPESNLLTIEGQKTIGLELALARSLGIEAILVPRGSGSLIISIYRGLKDAQASGWILDMPVFYSIALKRTSAAYLVESLETTTSRLLGEVSNILHETNGTEMEIDGEVMMDDALELARREGHFIEPVFGIRYFCSKATFCEWCNLTKPHRRYFNRIRDECIEYLRVPNAWDEESGLALSTQLDS